MAPNSAMDASSSGLAVRRLLVFPRIEYATNGPSTVFITEGFILSFIIIYLSLYLYGSYANRRTASKWFRTHREFYSSQFSKPGNESMILDDGPADMFAFSTGRRNVQSLHTIFTFLPVHDLFQLVFTYLWTLYDLRYSPSSDVTLDFKLGTKDTHPAGNAQPFIWAIVDKEELIGIKTKRWDLTLTKTQDNASVPKSCVVMSEVADVTDTILKSSAAASFLTALKDPNVAKYFKSISVRPCPDLLLSHYLVLLSNRSLTFRLLAPEDLSSRKNVTSCYRSKSLLHLLKWQRLYHW
jgi:hypothetical protein